MLNILGVTVIVDFESSLRKICNKLVGLIKCHYSFIILQVPNKRCIRLPSIVTSIKLNEIIVLFDFWKHKQTIKIH
jgi:hypothetical protein